MPTIGAVLRRLLPEGSRRGPRVLHRRCPDWPPDVFAVAATIVELGGIYARPSFTAGWDPAAFEFGGAYADEVRAAGEAWAGTGVPPRAVEALWRRLLGAADEELGQDSTAAAAWHGVALRLMTIADEACVGVGFLPDEGDGVEPFPRLVLLQLREAELGNPSGLLPHLPNSLCRMVPPQEACVQPKTSAPAVGCTLRSLTHHLALLPSLGVVRTEWHFAHPDENAGGPLNLLLVPLPFVLRGRDFAESAIHVDPANRFFSIDPGWLRSGEGFVAPEAVAAFILELIAAAKREASRVHGVVLPECALLDADAERIAELVAVGAPELELFVSGTTQPPPGPDEGAALPRNQAFTARLHGGQMLARWRQAKHHRWRLEDGQIRRYHLGHVLDPHCNWWERIDVGGRTVTFSVVRRGACLAVLVCEDLARFDPVLPVINAVGPNLVIALLMDGPQMESRWPGRYATVLADDPGSSVLSLTCAGMIERSCMPGKTSERKIALWKQPGDAAQELQIGPRDHGLLITLGTAEEEQITMDTRSDDWGTQRFRLTAARTIRLPDETRLDWPMLA